MIIISLYVNTGENLKKYTVKSTKLIVSQSSGNEKVILENVSNEFDCICDSSGKEHFLIQDATGGLLYLKYDKEVWKKYSIFVNKENKQKISTVHLTESMGVLCGFYAMEYNGSIMLVKHIFSETNLRSVPVVIDLLDSRKDFCICTDTNGNTLLFFRNAKGERIMTEFDKYFTAKSSGELENGKNIFSLCAINNGTDTFTAYTKLDKDYVSLVFSPLDMPESKKIITFAVAKNCMIAIYAKDERINLRWTENDIIMESYSDDCGKTFSKPKIAARGKQFDYIREKGIRAGLYADKIIFENDLKNKNQESNLNGKTSYTNTFERKIEMHNTYRRQQTDNFSDIDNKQIINRLGDIISEVEKIGKSLDQMCHFLDKLTEFKQSVNNDIFSYKEPELNQEISITNHEIGEKNEENIKKFESMSIDDAIPVKTIESIANGGDCIE